uniref:DUF1508 domain-containing protein n=1 Tax=Steinernema glaseri TaxID=37863 RepID=A0A1I7YNG6_9BILA
MAIRHSGKVFRTTVGCRRRLTVDCGSGQRTLLATTRRGLAEVEPKTGKEYPLRAACYRRAKYTAVNPAQEQRPADGQWHTVERSAETCSPPHQSMIDD